MQRLRRALASFAHGRAARGDPERAAELSEEGIAHYTRAGEQYAVLHPKLNLALARLEQGRLDEAFERLAGGLELARDLGYREEAIYYLEGIAATHAAAGEHARAARLAGAASSLAEETAVTLEPLDRDLHDGTVAACSAALGAAAFDAALAEGRALAHDQALAFALAGLPERQGAS